MRVLFLNKFNEYWKGKYKALKDEFPEVVFIATFNPDERPSELAKADVVITGRLLEEEILKAANLKMIFVPFTGLNTFPAHLLKEKNIRISNTHANARYVAEHAVTLCMALLGRIAELHNDLAKGFWHRSIEDEDMWITLQKKTISILGYGHIGEHIASYTNTFGCRVIGYKRNIAKGKTNNADELSNDLNYVLAKSDIVFLTLPLNNESENLLNETNLRVMHGKYLINVGRGVTVNEEALYNALKNGTLAGAALDVWYNYPGKKEEPVYPSSYPFHELKNVVLSPHKSSHTIEAITAMIDDTIESLRAYLKTGKSPNEVKI